MTYDRLETDRARADVLTSDLSHLSLSEGLQKRKRGARERSSDDATAHKQGQCSCGMTMIDDRWRRR